MPAVLEQKPPLDQFTSEVDEQIAQATSRIRMHDLAFGGLVLVAMLLVYATAMIVVDKYAVLPEWVRQVGLVGFVAALGGAAWFTIVRPMRRRVNPLYAAVQVEKTIDDAKNSVVGYVEAQESEQVHPAVKAAMGARAAKTVVEADVNRAIDHRSLLYVGGVAVAFLLALVVLFFVFRPAQFKSLAARTFTPFSSSEIATRTQLTLVEPAGGDVTITTGQSITVKVNVVGQVPSPQNPDRLRVLIRHNPAILDYEEVALEKGEHSREWLIRVPDYLVRNGFWYKVAGGDTETPEHRVTVRTLPLFTDFEVLYEYPAYTRMKPDTTRDAHLRAIKGTKVTILGKTNRQVKDGKLAFDPVTREPINGKVPADKPDSVQFSFTLVSSGQYRMTFTSADGERSPDAAPFKIEVYEDLAPAITIAKPVEDEIVLPANGHLAVDAAIADDLGIDKVVLKAKIVEPAVRELADRPFLEGKSFRRTEPDGTFSWPLNLDYKDSLDLAKLTDPAGLPVMLKEGMVIEYWLEATDNRTKPGASGPEPDPNNGKSAVKRVRLAPPVVAMDDKKNLDMQRDQRKNEEKASNDMQQQRLNMEKRDPQQPNGPPPMPMNDPMMQPMNMEPMMPKTDMGTPKEPMKGGGEPMMPPAKGGNDPSMPPPMNMNMGPNEAPMPSTPEQRNEQNNTKNTAEKIQEKINEQKGGGSAKQGPAEQQDQANPADAKPPMGGMPPPEEGPKEPPKSNDPMQANGGAESKPMGNPQQQPEPGSTKPEPKSDSNPMGGSPAEAKPVPKNMDPMMGGTSSEKPTPMNTPPEGAKPATQEQPMPGGMDQPNPANGAGQPKPMPQSGPSAEKPQPMGGGSPQDPKSKPDDGGTAKPQSGPPPSESKPGPMNSMMEPMGGSSESKPAPDMNMMGKAGPAEARPDMTKPNNMGGMPEKGIEKPNPEQQPSGGNGGQKPTPEQQKEFENAVKDLASKDPAKQQAARDKLDQMVGEKNRKDIEQGVKDFEKNVKDLNSKDEKTRTEAQKNLDRQIGEQNRKEIENIQKGMNSNDPKERAAAEEKLKDLQQKAGAGKADMQPKGGNGEQPKVDPKEVEKAMKDLQSPDKATRDAAKDKLDKTFGKGAGDKAEQLQNDLKSDDMAKRDAAKKEIEGMQKKAEEFAKNNPPKKENGTGGGGEKKIDPKEVEQAMKDLQSPDKATRDAAKEKLDKTLGKGAGDKAEQLQNDLKSDDMAKRDAAKKEIEGMQKKAEELAKNQPKGGNGKKVDPKEVEQALDDLNSEDPKTREAAKQKLDDMLGKGAGDKAEQMTKDLNSGDPQKQGPARKERDDLLNQAEKMAKGENPKPKELSKEERDRLEKTLKDLNSKDEQARKKAEQELDQQIGEQARKEIQEAMKDPKKAEELAKKMEELRHGGGDPSVPVRDAMKEDARNRAKSAELQLEQFEKNKDNKDLLKELNMTSEEYQRFLKRFGDEVAKLKKEVEDLEKTDPKKGGPATTNISQGGKIDSQGAKSGAGSAGGPTFAAPGYADALKMFQEGVRKVPPKK